MFLTFSSSLLSGSSVLFCEVTASISMMNHIWFWKDLKIPNWFHEKVLVKVTSAGRLAQLVSAKSVKVAGSIPVRAILFSLSPFREMDQLNHLLYLTFLNVIIPWYEKEPSSMRRFVSNTLQFRSRFSS
ncbi:hypothetical protein CRENBAI_012841 [Crenichthys baileyi]|uniref:Uncharacterized protein n=1 Tax=Crenichthys baileyi TaxID=28760 RepID=A0AAV9RK38_9TELE